MHEYESWIQDARFYSRCDGIDPKLLVDITLSSETKFTVPLYLIIRRNS